MERAMTTHSTVVLAAAVVVLAGGVCADAQPVATTGTWRSPASKRTSPLRAGSITSFVRDASGAPVSGAIVSAVGGRTLAGTTDAKGRCTLAELPAGEYLVRVHRAGFGTANSLVVRVTAGTAASHDVVLKPLRGTAPDRAAAAAILAAGFSSAGVLPAPAADGSGSVGDPVDAEDHDHSELAWRLRHLRRSVLQDAVDQAVIDRDGDGGGEDDEDGMAGTFFGRAMTAPARAAAALFTDLPLTGEVNLLTSSSFDSAGQMLSDASVARGVAYVSIGAAAGQRGDWSVQGAMTQGDVSSWLFAGSFLARKEAVHRYEAGMAYAAQRYTGTNPASLASVAEGTRTAGAMFAFDTWTLSRRATLVYGGRVARYGYVDKALFSPRARLDIAASDHLRISLGAALRAEAPGAEEFVPSSVSETWLPPERTFAPLVGTRFRPERTHTYEIAIAQDLGTEAVLGLRTFFQRTEDQVATLFGLGLAPAVGDLDHYAVSSAGDFVARGWTVRISRVVARRVRGSIDYTVTTAEWGPSPDGAALAQFAPSAVRAGDERHHDLTTSVQADIPVTDTRVFALYRVNTAFVAAQPEDDQPGTGARFDVQVTQALPFLNFTNAQWEMLFGIRNMFRELAPDASVYDELLVLRPPKRVVGGLTVRF
jgi:hypothetical protein